MKFGDGQRYRVFQECAYDGSADVQFFHTVRFRPLPQVNAWDDRFHVQCVQTRPQQTEWAILRLSTDESNN